VEFVGASREASGAYRRQLAAEANPDELQAGLREWGTGEARILDAALLDDDGDERRQFAAGEPATLRLEVAADEGVPPPRVSLELRDDGGLVLGGTTQATRELGWDGGAGRHEVRFRIDRLPPADRRLHPRRALAGEAGG